jgi:hypothetical protein
VKVTERLAELFESAEEIVFNGEILLIKWWMKTRKDGSLFVGKDRLLEEPWRLGSSSGL